MAFKVRPTAEVLSTINSNVPCPEEGCSNIFSSESNLTLHLAKTHGKSELMKGDGVRKEYHCPQVDCIYSDAAHFKTMKLLKQHYLKMHGEKKYVCSKCSKGFPIESALKAHGDYCGVQFECPDCHNNYPCYETLKTHCRRKKHRVFKKQHYKLDRSDNLKSRSEIFVKPKEKYLLPKSSSLPVLVLPAVRPNSIDQSVQTDIAMELFRNDSRESQICSETQTIYTRTSDITLNKANIETQTNPVKSESKSCNTSFTSDNFDFTDIPITRNSSSTQTAMLSMNDLLDFTSASQNFNDFDFNCNMETQTDVFGDDLFNYSDYNGLIMSELGLNDTQTQTLLDDVRSVESQTMMSHAKRAMLSCRHMANMETQTDAEFKQMLDEINA